MKNVVSFCLWGTNPYYLDGAVRALTSARKFYPGWEYWFYLAADVPEQTVTTLRAEGGHIIRKQRGEGRSGKPENFEYEPAFWRFLPASDPEVGILIVRDTDSPVTTREVAAVNEWLASDKQIHIMRDHPMHEYPILAGMWGCRTEAFRDMEQKISRWKHFSFYGCDQKFLGTVLYPTIRDVSWIHSCCIRFPSETIHAFPTKRENTEFIGISVTGDARVSRETEILAEWIRAGGKRKDRPLPWSYIGRSRHYIIQILRRLGFR